ncbi:hypothetical protein HID58_062309 [Brassica napus]|uniref:Replication protein A OB domain-containing protein n=1 Tax=Brassica napus TaxID=3708 RepID=A0ABQ8A1A4_BRANA|nr:hypothetical protein HID58_062309 [Brassica napus]
MSIISNSNVTNSSLKNDDKFLSLTSFKEIMNGSLDSNFLIDVIGQAIDIGDIQVVPMQGGKETKKLELTLTDTEDQQVACCLWGRFAEQMLYTSKVAQVNQKSCSSESKLSLFTEIYQNQCLQGLPNNDLALTTGSHEVAKTQGNKRQPDKWSTYPERSILDIIMATESDDENTEDTLTNIALSDRSSGQVSLISIESEDTTCLSSTPLSKRKGNNEIDDLSSTSKKQCSKIIKVEKNCGEMKRKYQPPLGADGHRLCSKPQSKQRIDHKKNKDVPLSTVFARLLHDVTNRKVSSRFQTQVTVSNPTNKRVVLSFDSYRTCFSVICFDKENNDNSKQTKKSRIHEDFLGSIDECDDLEVESSSQDSSDTEISDDEQSTVQEPEKVDQSGRVNLLAALFKKTLSEVKTKAKAVSSKEDG